MPPYNTINVHPPHHSLSDLTTDTFDVIVIGSGWAGRTLAPRVVKAGMSVVIIESELVGGDCPFWACVPSKVLLESRTALDASLAVGGARENFKQDPKVDAKATFARRDAFTANWDDGKVLVPMVQAAGAQLVRGTGKLVGEKRVEISSIDGDSKVLVARQAVVLGTGSEPIIPDIPGLAEAKPWTPRQATSSSTVPERLVILGAGAVGCEMATAYSSFGSKTTLISSTAEILPRLDDEAGRLVRQSLEAEGVDILLSSQVTGVVRRENSSVKLSLASGKSLEADELLVATGRRPRVVGIGLKELGIQEDGAPIPVDESLCAKAVKGDWLYATGDMNGRNTTTHGSKYHGRIVGNAIIARAHGLKLDVVPFDKYSATADQTAVPQVVFTTPTVASVGQTRKAVLKAGSLDRVRFVTATLNSIASRIKNDQAQDGWGHLVIDLETNRILGATFVGDDVSEVLHSATVAVVGGMTLERMAHAVPSFPTVSEIWLTLLDAADL
ncbi:hypothetical protein JX266_004582 [Neoarthrinium moseri]|nr:hypothetical protein JX266_004582 [Neoarthrinium moseri]